MSDRVYWDHGHCNAVTTQGESKAGAFASFVLHQFASTWGVGWTAPYVAISARPVLALLGKPYGMPSVYWILSETPYFPVQILLGLLLGYMIGRHFQHRSMRWVWVIPLAILCYAVIAVPTFFPNLTPSPFQAGVGESRLSHYVGWGCQPKGHCIDQIYTTLLFYSSVSYSLGALLAAKLPARFRHPNPRNFWVYLLVAVLFFVQFFGGLRRGFVETRQTGYWASYLGTFSALAGLGSVCVLYAILVGRSELKSGPKT